jgi:PKD repeat protein
MFLDLDGDGVYTGNDRMPPPGDAATIDLYVVTNQNRDGSPVTCSDGTTPGISSYSVNLYALDAAVSFSNVTNQMPGMIGMAPLETYPYALSAWYAGASVLPPGKYHLMSMTAAFGAGCPALAIVTSTCYSPEGVVTSFGSDCPGVQGDYTLRMEEDWAGSWGFSCTDLPGRWPSITCPGEVSGLEEEPITIPVTLTDPDCGIFSFSVYGLPPGATFSGLGPFVAGEASGAVSWTPGVGQAGTYSIRFDGSDYPNWFHGITQRDTCTTRVTVRASNVGPAADAGGPYSGVQGVPIAFDGTRSNDPEGGPLEFSWDFGDGAQAMGSTPTHAYASGGSYVVTLNVTDPGGLSSQSTTTASISRNLPVRVFTSAGNRSTRLERGRPFTCFQIEAVPEAPFELEGIVPSSVRLHYEDPQCGGLEGSPMETKLSRIRDTDRNGLSEYEICFARENLASLVACRPPGVNSLLLELRGSLANGDRIHGSFSHTITSGSGSLAAAISPNPLSARSVLEFTTTVPGFVRARLFDIRGRFVATLMDQGSVQAGYHRIPLAGYEVVPVRLASGVYFVSVVTESDGSVRRAVVVLK